MIDAVFTVHNVCKFRGRNAEEKEEEATEGRGGRRRMRSENRTLKLILDYFIGLHTVFL